MSQLATPQEQFVEMYRGEAPWDVPHPQQEFEKRLDQITGDVLDVGCGTGENSLYLAAQGRRVLGIDFAQIAIYRAREKARERGSSAAFCLHDATRLRTLEIPTRDGRVDCVIDSGLFHCLSDEQRTEYIDGLAHVLRPGGRMFMMCFSEHEPGTHGPRRVTKEELHAAFADGWTIEAIDQARFQTIPHLKEMEFSPGGPKSYFCTIRRNP